MVCLASQNIIDMGRLSPEQLARNGTEHGEQSALFAWIVEHRAEYPDLEKLYAVNNNAGLGDPVRGARARMAGVKEGVADTVLPVARHGLFGLYLEMKVKDKKKAKVSPAQKVFAKTITEDGYGYAVAYGWEHATWLLLQYIAGPKTRVYP